MSIKYGRDTTIQSLAAWVNSIKLYALEIFNADGVLLGEIPLGHFVD